MFSLREPRAVGSRQETVRGMGFRGRGRKGNRVVRRGLRPLSGERIFDGCVETSGRREASIWVVPQRQGLCPKTEIVWDRGFFCTPFLKPISTRKGAFYMKTIPHRLYLTEDQIPTHYYNLRAAMPEQPDSMLNPGTLSR